MNSMYDSSYRCDYYLKYLKENILNNSTLYIGCMNNGDFINCYINSFTTLAKLYNNTFIRYQKIQAWMEDGKRYLILSKTKFLNMNQSNRYKKSNNNLYQNSCSVYKLFYRSKKKRKLH